MYIFESILRLYSIHPNPRENLYLAQVLILWKKWINVEHLSTFLKVFRCVKNVDNFLTKPLLNCYSVLINRSSLAWISSLYGMSVKGLNNNFILIEERKEYFYILKNLIYIGVFSIRGVLEVLQRSVRTLKSHFLESVMGYFSQAQKDLILGMVFGETQKNNVELEHSLKVIGMQHVVSASGFNVSLTVSLASLFVSRFYRILKALCLVGIIILYGWLADFSPSVVRAVVMMSISVSGTLIAQRQYHPLRALIATAVIMVAIDSAYLTSVSFQLSFLATLGIIKGVPLLVSSKGWIARLEAGNIDLVDTSGQFLGGRASFANRVQKGLILAWEVFKESFVTTVAAQLFTLPLTLVLFKEISWLSFVSNPLLLWLTPFITIGGLVFILISSSVVFIPGLKILLMGSTWALSWVVSVFIWGVVFLGQFSFLLVEVKGFGWGMAASWWLFLGLLSWSQAWSLRRRKRYHQRFFYDSQGKPQPSVARRITICA